jgi:hypothetical protein
MSEELSDITEVLETSSTNEVNNFLSSGWKLINTYTTAAFSTETSNEIVVYVLGKPQI